MTSDNLELKSSNMFAFNSQILMYEDGQESLEREPLEWPVQNGDLFHTVKENENLVVLADRFYSPFVEDPEKYWHVIADANDIEFGLDLSELVGQNIIIPNILNVNLKRE